MFALGLYRKFKINRPLADEDVKGHVNQQVHIPFQQSELVDDMAFIRLNSTYLEVADVYYKDRGVYALVGWVFFLLTFGGWICFWWSSYIHSFAIGFIIFFNVVLILDMLFCSLFIYKESFSLTHFPIRFNRRKRLIHLFHLNGRVKNYAWDDIYFTIKSSFEGYGGKQWYLCGHILAEDGITIRESFSVSMYDSRRENVVRFWELVRRYMEAPDGVKQAADIAWCFLPVAEKRESFGFGLCVLLVRGRHWLTQLLMLPFAFLQAFTRWFCMHTSKIPRWPDEVEQQCRVETGDKYNYDSNSVDMKRYWRFLFHWRWKEYTSVTGRKWKL
ncbi:DUF6708 domain-containing protein [Citrobacter arsenatis]|uniref:DUF6708 domain-containing protein n=1 Tax=Citrobacter arsenatis TaxID=2546350 RepID=UPI00300DEC09